MTWDILAPKAPKPAKLAPPVTLRVSKAGRFQARMTIVVRPALLPELAWWRHGAPCEVALGRDEHAGRLRITPGGARTLHGRTGKFAAKGNPNPPAVTVTRIPGMPEDGLGPVVPAWEVVDEALIVTLPWMRATGATPWTRATAATKVQTPDAKSQTSETKPPVIVPATALKPSPVLAARVAVLGKIMAAQQGKLSVDALSHAEIKTARECEDHGLAEFLAGSKYFVMKPAGAHLLTRARQAGML